MAHNYQQPFYGTPFQYPPPQMQQQPPPPPPPPQNAHAPVDASSAYASLPQTPVYSHLPGLQPPPAPSPSNMNNSAYGANMQQPPFPHAGWPTDPNALFAFMHSVSQNGQLPPPPLPGFAFPPPPSLPHTPQLPVTPTHFTPQSHQPVRVHDRVREVMKADKEDGELSEGDAPVHTPASSLPARFPPEPHRSVPQVARAPLHTEDVYNPDQPAAGQVVATQPPPQALQTKPSQSPAEVIQQSREQAKQFVKLLHSNNIGYRTLAKEDLDLDLLRGLYSSLNLPSEPAPIVAPKIPVAHPNTDQTAAAPQKKPSPALKTGIAAAPPAKAAPSPVDRKEYIARLQAAKLAAKQPAATKPNSPPPTAPVSTKATEPPAQPDSSTATPTSKPVVTEEQRARTTEIIKQRLEKLKAKGHSQLKPNGTTVGPKSPAQTEQAKTTTASGQQTSSFPGIPGLFMGNSTNNVNLTTATPVPSVPQKRPAPSDSTGPSTPRGSVTPYTRPLGDSPHVYQEESMIIEVSDDESNGSEMDIDDEQTGPKTALATPLGGYKARTHPGSIPNFQSQSGSAAPGSSAASTPGPQTPSTQAREEELKRKEDELVAMRLKLRQKIADRIAKEKAEKAAASPAATAQQSSLATRSKATEIGSVNEGPVSGATLNNGADSVRAVKRRRREEIQTRLSTFDAELASGTEKMNRLMRELDELKASHERLARDKQQLVDELEGLGVDTDGMSHAEMQAKRTEIEREMTPAPDGFSQKPDVPKSAIPDLTIHEQSSAHQATTQFTMQNASVASDVTAPRSAGLPGLTTYVPPEGGTPTRPSQALTVDKIPSQEPLQFVGPSQPAKSMVTGSLNDLPSSRQELTMQDSATPEDTDDFYSPPGADATGAEGVTVLEVTRGKREPERPSVEPLSEEGEVEMSESSEDEEEEYEPEEVIPTNHSSQQETQFTDGKPPESHNTSDVSTEDEDIYEPPDAEETLSDMHIDDRPGVDTNEPFAEVDEGAMDIASSEEEETEDSGSDSDVESDSESGLDASIPASHSSQPQDPVADDLAPELQAAAPAEVASAEDEEDEVVKFTPYESPLRMFKSYRYHSNFANDVAGGFLSSTFSHQIDPETPFCQYELAGGSCNDPQCPFQHFRDVGLTGEALLVQLGTANPGKTPEEKQQWNDGLRGVLKELRKKNIKDPNGIAAEIANYRRQFLNDDTRVVNL